MHRRGAKLLALFVLLLEAFIFAQSARTDYVKILKDERIEDRLRLLEPKILLENYYKDDRLAANANRTCARDFALYRQAVARRELWALKMLDSSSKIPAGLLQGNIIDLGMFDECMETTSEGASTGVAIRGRYCMYSISPLHPSTYTFPLNLRMSICVPASCDAEDVVDFVNGIVNDNNEVTGSQITVLSANCTRMDEKIKGTEFFVAVAFYVVCVGYVALCTLCDLANRRFGIGASWTIARFSVLRSAEAILSTKVREGELPVVHGMRVISTAWVVIVHEYFFPIITASVNMLDLNKFFASWASMLPLIGLYSVDTFFTLSGFLMTYTFYKKMQKNAEFNLFHHYLHRYLRLTFPVVTIVASAFVILSFNASGPIYEMMEEIFLGGCRSKWWSFILYIQNFVENDNYSLLHLWAVSVEMQLFWISPLILYPLYKKPNVGLAITTLLFLVSVIGTSVVIGMNKYSAIYFTHEPDIQFILKSFREVYVMPYTRASPWLIGILLGYIVSCHNQKPNKVKIYMGWLLATLSFAFCLFGTRSFTAMSYEYNLVWEVAFVTIARPAWAFGICWIIYASIHNSAGRISSFLSWKMFLPLSKLSYSVYLVHLIFPVLRIMETRTAIHFNNYTILHSYVGDMALATVLAFFFSLLFEMPMLILNDTILKKKSESTYEMKNIR